MLVLRGRDDQSVAVEQSIGPLRIVQRAGHGTVPDELWLRLARLVSRVEWAFGEGQDPYTVEWAWDGCDVWLTGVAPMRDVPRRTLQLALDQPTAWSNANLSDAVAGVPTTLTWSFVAPFLRSIFYAPLEQVGYRMPRGVEMVRRFDGRAYLDLTSLQASYFDALGAPPADVARSLGSPVLDITMPAPEPAVARRRALARLRLSWLLVRHPRRYADSIARMHRAARSFRLDLHPLRDEDLIGVAERIAQLQAWFGPLFQIGNFAAGVWSDALRQTMERALPGAGDRLAASLMAGGGDVVSAEHGYRLFDLAATLAHDGESAYREALERFLDEFGHRGVYEAELANPRWVEEPSFVDAQVRGILAGGSATVPRQAALARRTVAELELRRLPPGLRLVIRWLAMHARRAAAQREAGKSALIAMALPVRAVALEFGRRMVARDVLDQTDDIFHLARADLEAFVRGEWDGRGARALVAERRARRDAQLAALPPPDLIVEGLGVADCTAGARGSELRGLAASPGRARGRVRRLAHPAAGASLAARRRTGGAFDRPWLDAVVHACSGGCHRAWRLPVARRHRRPRAWPARRDWRQRRHDQATRRRVRHRRRQHRPGAARRRR